MSRLSHPRILSPPSRNPQPKALWLKRPPLVWRASYTDSSSSSSIPWPCLGLSSSPVPLDPGTCLGVESILNLSNRGSDVPTLSVCPQSQAQLFTLPITGTFTCLCHSLIRVQRGISPWWGATHCPPRSSPILWDKGKHPMAHRQTLVRKRACGVCRASQPGSIWEREAGSCCLSSLSALSLSHPCGPPLGTPCYHLSCLLEEDRV